MLTRKLNITWLPNGKARVEQQYTKKWLAYSTCFFLDTEGRDGVHRRALLALE